MLIIIFVKVDTRMHLNGGTKCYAKEVAIAETGMPEVKTRCWWKYHVLKSELAELSPDALQLVVTTKPWVTGWGWSRNEHFSPPPLYESGIFAPSTL